MSDKFEVVYHGFKELAADLTACEAILPQELRAGMKASADVIRDDVRGRASRFGPRTVGGIRSRVRKEQAYVEQSLRKSADLSLRRPNFAGLQDRVAFGPAAGAGEEVTYLAIQAALERAMAKYRL